MIQTFYEQLDFAPDPENTELSESFQYAGLYVKKTLFFR
jgi:hypothetical protein